MNCLKYLVEDTYNKIQDFFIYIYNRDICCIPNIIRCNACVCLECIFIFNFIYLFYVMVMESEIMFSSFEKVDATRLATRVL